MKDEPKSVNAGVGDVGLCLFLIMIVLMTQCHLQSEMSEALQKIADRR